MNSELNKTLILFFTFCFASTSFAQTASHWFTIDVEYGENLKSNNDFLYQHITEFYYANAHVQAERKKAMQLNFKLNYNKTNKKVSHLHSYGIGIGLNSNSYFLEDGVIDNSSDYAFALNDKYPITSFKLEKKDYKIRTISTQGVSINYNKIRINNALNLGTSLIVHSSSKHKYYTKREGTFIINPIIEYHFSLAFGGKQNNKWNVGVQIPLANNLKEHFIFTNIYQKTFMPRLLIGLKL